MLSIMLYAALGFVVAAIVDSKNRTASGDSATGEGAEAGEPEPRARRRASTRTVERRTIIKERAPRKRKTSAKKDPTSPQKDDTAASGDGKETAEPNDKDE